MEKLIITAAICGAEVTKEQNPAVPYTVEEMVREAKSAYEAAPPFCTSTSARTTAPPPRTVSASAWSWTPSARSCPTLS